MSNEEKAMVQTHVAPSYTNHPRTGDVYPAYNKPVAVIDWLAKTDVSEDFVLIIDADMIMRKPIIPKDVGARKGWAVSAFFGYMKGVNNALAMKHIPQVPPRQDSFAGPSGRRSDQIGGFTLMQTEDLRKVAPLWLKYTEDVRFDPDVRGCVEQFVFKSDSLTFPTKSDSTMVFAGLGTVRRCLLKKTR
jgi:hypothetical protein